MRRIVPIVLLTVFPLAVAAALSIPAASSFPDVRTTSKEAAGINFLASRGYISGYPDGRFGPTRLINRAEFLKIAMLSTGDSHQYMPKTCFSDVREGDWFSPMVCAAKARAIVKGRTENMFVPSDPVQYGEALKMLTLLYGYDIYDAPGTWAESYYRAAAKRSVDLPMTIRLDSLLARGQAARLIGAFLAEHEGDLAAFRLAENGIIVPSSLSSSATNTSSSSSSAPAPSSSVTSSVASSSSSEYSLPATSHFLVVGETSLPIASIVVRSSGEAARIASAQVKVTMDIRSLERLELATLTGGLVASLLQRTTTDTPDYKQIFEVSLSPDRPWTIPADKDVPLVLRAVVRAKGNNGFSEELVDLRSFTVTLQTLSSNETRTVVGDTPFPKHQTAFGRITSVRSAGEQTGVLKDGTGMVVGSFSFRGRAVTGSTVGLEELLFTIDRTGNVQVNNWSLTRHGSSANLPCTIGSDSVVTCLGLTSLGGLTATDDLTLDLRADIRGADGSSLRASLEQPGSPAALGSVQWTDGSGHFRWMEGVKPLAVGTLWRQ